MYIVYIFLSFLYLNASNSYVFLRNRRSNQTQRDIQSNNILSFIISAVLNTYSILGTRVNNIYIFLPGIFSKNYFIVAIFHTASGCHLPQYKPNEDGFKLCTNFYNIQLIYKKIFHL